MAVICIECGKVAENNDFFFDTSSSETGLDINREDCVVCISCIMNYINKNTFKEINLIRRIENPYYAG